MSIHNVIDITIRSHVLTIARDHMPFSFHVQFNNLGNRVAASVKARPIHSGRIDNRYIETPVDVSHGDLFSLGFCFFIGVKEANNPGIIFRHRLIPGRADHTCC